MNLGTQTIIHKFIQIIRIPTFNCMKLKSWNEKTKYSLKSEKFESQLERKIVAKINDFEKSFAFLWIIRMQYENLQFFTILCLVNVFQKYLFD